MLNNFLSLRAKMIFFKIKSDTFSNKLINKEKYNNKAIIHPEMISVTLYGHKVRNFFIKWQKTWIIKIMLCIFVRIHFFTRSFICSLNHALAFLFCRTGDWTQSLHTELYPNPLKKIFWDKGLTKLPKLWENLQTSSFTLPQCCVCRCAWGRHF